MDRVDFSFEGDFLFSSVIPLAVKIKNTKRHGRNDSFDAKAN
jgi:hypothetical protein